MNNMYEKIARFINTFALGMNLAKVSMFPYDLDDYIWITLNLTVLLGFAINDAVVLCRRYKSNKQIDEEA